MGEEDGEEKVQGTNLPPRRALVATTRHMRLQIDRPHIHDAKGILLLIRDPRNHSRVDHHHLAKPAHLSNAKNDRTGREIANMVLLQGLGDGTGLVVALVEALLVEVVGGGVQVLFGAGQGDVRGVQVAVGEEDAVFVVAADAGGVGADEEVDDAGGVGAFGDGVAGEDQVVVFRVEGEFVEEFVDWWGKC